MNSNLITINQLYSNLQSNDNLKDIKFIKDNISSWGFTIILPNDIELLLYISIDNIDNKKYLIDNVYELSLINNSYTRSVILHKKLFLYEEDIIEELLYLSKI